MPYNTPIPNWAFTDALATGGTFNATAAMIVAENLFGEHGRLHISLLLSAPPPYAMLIWVCRCPRHGLQRQGRTTHVFPRVFYIIHVVRLHSEHGRDRRRDCRRLRWRCGPRCPRPLLPHRAQEDACGRRRAARRPLAGHPGHRCSGEGTDVRARLSGQIFSGSPPL